MGLADPTPPAALSHRDNVEIGQDDGPMNGSGYFSGALNTQNMSIIVPKGDKWLELGPLASGHNLQNLILERCPQKKVNNLRFLDGQGEEINLLQGLELQVLDQVAQLDDRNPAGPAALPPQRGPQPRCRH